MLRGRHARSGVAPTAAGEGRVTADAVQHVHMHHSSLDAFGSEWRRGGGAAERASVGNGRRDEVALAQEIVGLRLSFR